MNYSKFSGILILTEISKLSFSTISSSFKYCCIMHTSTLLPPFCRTCSKIARALGRCAHISTAFYCSSAYSRLTATFKTETSSVSHLPHILSFKHNFIFLSKCVLTFLESLSQTVRVLPALKQQSLKIFPGHIYISLFETEPSTIYLLLCT